MTPGQEIWHTRKQRTGDHCQGKGRRARKEHKEKAHRREVAERAQAGDRNGRHGVHQVWEDFQGRQAMQIATVKKACEPLICHEAGIEETLHPVVRALGV